MANTSPVDRHRAAHLLAQRFGTVEAAETAVRERLLRVPDEIAEQIAACDDEDEARRIMALALHRAMAAAVGEDVMRLLDGHATQ